MRLLLLALGLLLLPLVQAHGDGRDDFERRLAEAGDVSVLRDFDAPLAGALVVVPYQDGSLACAGALDNDRWIRAGDGFAVAFRANATHLFVDYFLVDNGTGYAGIAVDTGDLARALILMEEQAVADHRLVAVASEEKDNFTSFRSRHGLLGIPFQLGGSAAHHIDYQPEGGGILISYDEAEVGTSCMGLEPGHVGFAFGREELPRSLSTGRILHILALHDPAIPAFLPRPIDGSTIVYQANLYLARPGEEAAALEEAFHPRLRVPDVLPLLALVVGGAWIQRRP